MRDHAAAERRLMEEDIERLRGTIAEQEAVTQRLEAQLATERSAAEEVRETWQREVRALRSEKTNTPQHAPRPMG